jgi:uncharacterized protein YecT (DUF1311 family)
MKLNKFSHIFSTFMALLMVAPDTSVAASYNCAKASTATERAICDFPELSALDDIMGQAYQSAKQSSKWITPEDLRRTQKNWLKKRNTCGRNVECLRTAYTQRLDEISDGVLFLNVGRKVMSYIYRGEPISGACSNGTTLNDLGQCVNWFRGGPSFRGVSVAGIMAFSFEYLAPNAHTCALSGRADKVNGRWIYQDEGATCKLHIEVGANGLSLNPTPGCNYYCGMRAQGAMEQIIEY